VLVKYCYCEGANSWWLSWQTRGGFHCFDGGARTTQWSSRWLLQVSLVPQQWWFFRCDIKRQGACDGGSLTRRRRRGQCSCKCSHCVMVAARRAKKKMSRSTGTAAVTGFPTRARRRLLSDVCSSGRTRSWRQQRWRLRSGLVRKRERRRLGLGIWLCEGERE